MKRYILLGCGFFLLLKIASAYAAVGDITTFGGTGTLGDNGGWHNDLKQTQFKMPVYVLAYQYGLYVVDRDNHRVLRTSNKGGNNQVEPVAGKGGTGGFSGDNGPARDAELDNPAGIALDDKGNLYIADTDNYVIRKVDIGGTITTVAGTPGTAGDIGDGAAKSALLNSPQGVAVDKTGNFLYIADTNNHKIRKVDINAGTISTFAGVGGFPGVGGDGGRAIEARLSSPSRVTVHNDVVYIMDSGNNRIREVTSGIINTTAGNGAPGYTGNGGPAISASLNDPQDITVDREGNLFIADAGDHVIRKIDATTKKITTIAGTATIAGGPSEGDYGPATLAKLNAPRGVTIDRDGNLYIADTNNYSVRKVEGVAASTGGTVVIPPSGGGTTTVAPPPIPVPGGGTLIKGNGTTSDLWIKAIILAEDKGVGPIEAVWKQGGDSKTSRGDRVIWGYFYANPNDVPWGSVQNPDLFVKIWYDYTGRIYVDFFHVSAPKIEVYSAIPGMTGASFDVSTKDIRFVEHSYVPKDNVSTKGPEVKTVESPIVSVNGNPPYSSLPSFDDLGLGAYIQDEKNNREINGVFRFGDSGTTKAGQQVAWGFFHASPADVDWGSSDNPDVFVKAWIENDGRIDVNFFHVSVPYIKVYSGRNNRYEQQAEIIKAQRYTRHEYHKQSK